MIRTDLKVLRVKNGLTQYLMATKLGVSVASYSLIERGQRNGNRDFWLKLQKEFNLTGEEVWKLQNPQI